MIGNLLSFMCGGLFGVVMMCLFMVASEEERKLESLRENCDADS